MNVNDFLGKILARHVFLSLIITLTSDGFFPKNAMALCSIESVKSGSLHSVDNYTLSSEESRGTITIRCEGGESINAQITSINNLEGADFDQTMVSLYDSLNQSLVTANTLSAPPPQNSSLLLIPDFPSSQAYSLELTLQNTARIIPAGNYRYSITITFVPS